MLLSCGLIAAGASFSSAIAACDRQIPAAYTCQKLASRIISDTLSRSIFLSRYKKIVLLANHGHVYRPMRNNEARRTKTNGLSMRATFFKRFLQEITKPRVSMFRIKIS